MYQLVYKQDDEINWKYSNRVNKISDFNNKYKFREFFIQNINYLIVYSS